jgi:hypothetical protein
MANLINNSQRMRLYGLLNKTKLLGRKHALVYDFTSGRSESTKELYYSEADLLIRHLESLFREEDKCDKMRKKIISMAREMGWETIVNGKVKADMNSIESWCIKFGQFHKGLNQHKYNELTALVTQFEQVYKSFLKGI